MRISIGHNVANSYVRQVYLGEQSVTAIYKGEKMIFPDDEGMVKRLTVEIPEAGTLDWVYWVHALSACTDLTSQSRYMLVTAGGAQACLGGTYGIIPLVTLEGNTLIYGSGDGPALQDIQIGDMITVKAVIPAVNGIPTIAKGENTDVENTYSLPWIPSIKFSCSWGKGQKRASAGFRFVFTGLQSGVTHMSGYTQSNGHWRGTATGTLTPATSSSWNGGALTSSCVGYNLGDIGYKVSLEQYNASSNATVIPVYPAFTKTWTLKVLSIVTNN